MRSFVACLVLLVLLVAAGPAGCAGERLNSERIAARYGSYDVTVLRQDRRWRVSSLESRHDGRQVTRTLAVVRFENPGAQAFIAEERRIRAGASIGSTFRDAGWRIDKPTAWIAEITVPAEARSLGALMQIPLPAALALHVYRFDVSRGGRRLVFATIAEIHHPDYLDERALERIYPPAVESRPDDLLTALENVLLQLPSPDSRAWSPPGRYRPPPRAGACPAGRRHCPPAPAPRRRAATD